MIIYVLIFVIFLKGVLNCKTIEIAAQPDKSQAPEWNAHSPRSDPKRGPTRSKSPHTSPTCIHTRLELHNSVRVFMFCFVWMVFLFVYLFFVCLVFWVVFFCVWGGGEIFCNFFSYDWNNEHGEFLGCIFLSRYTFK